MAQLPRLDWNDPSVAGFDAFGREHQEHLDAEIIDAIYLSSLDWEIELARLRGMRDRGESLEIYAYNRKTIDASIFESLEDIQCDLEDRNDLAPEPQENWKAFTDEGRAEVQAAYDAFVAAFVKNYQVWACEPVAIVAVPVKELYDEAGKLELEYFWGEVEE